MARPTKIKLTELCLDAGTQARVEINQQTVDDYAERMLDGDVFIGVDVWTDGKTKWLSDGFHRYYATKKNGLDTISCKMHDGTLLDAIWDALEANKINGLPRTNADKVKAVNMALKHWPTKSNRELAQQIGVSEAMVREHRKGDKPAHGAHPPYQTETPQPSTPPKVTSKTDPIGEIPMGEPPVHHEPPAEDWTVPPESDGQGRSSGDDKRDENPPAPPAAPAPLSDKIGTDLAKLHGPLAESIRDAFRRRNEITAAMRKITTLKHEILKSHKTGDKLYSNLNPSGWEADGANFRRNLTMLLPHAVCPYCSGDGCKSCHGLGWLSRYIYIHTPEYLAANRSEVIKDDDE